MISITVHHHHHRQQAAQLVAMAPSLQHDKASQLQVQYLSQAVCKQQQQVVAQDANNNNVTCKNAHIRQTSGPTRVSPARQEPADDRQQENDRPKSSHSRSISLIVNPEFSSSESNASDDQHCRLRRATPRLPRRLRQLEPLRLDQQAPVAEAGKPVEPATRNSAPDLIQLPEPQTIEIGTNRSEQQTRICLHFRQTGAMLREISDQFSKSRRRTI